MRKNGTLESHTLGRIFADHPNDSNWVRLYNRIEDEVLEEFIRNSNQLSKRVDCQNHVDADME